MEKRLLVHELLFRFSHFLCAFLFSFAYLSDQCCLTYRFVDRKNLLLLAPGTNQVLLPNRAALSEPFSQEQPYVSVRYR